MSQVNLVIDPAVHNGHELALMLNEWRDALHSTHKGVARPEYAQAGMLWIDDSLPGKWQIYMFDGEIDIPLSMFAGGSGGCEVPFYKADGTLDTIQLVGENCGGGSGSGGKAGVSQIKAGSGVSVSPDTGVGVVTVKSITTIPFFTTSGDSKPIPLNP
jgi:hypothetical protein